MIPHSTITYSNIELGLWIVAGIFIAITVWLDHRDKD